jgi:hypothetical protein
MFTCGACNQETKWINDDSSAFARSGRIFESSGCDDITLTLRGYSP